ncbi:hypothetical protein HDU78_011184, partial [Chytriomyces hyalinus]
MNSIAVGASDSANIWPRGGNLWNSEASRGRTVVDFFSPIQTPVSPSGGGPQTSSGSGAPPMPLPGKPGPAGRLGSINANPNGEDAIISSLRAENENLKKMLAAKG